MNGMIALIVAVVPATTAFATAGASAQDPGCAAVAKAYVAQNTAPTYRMTNTTIDLKSRTTKRSELLYTPDSMYAREGNDAWGGLPLPLQDRREGVEAAIRDNSPYDCKLLGTESLNGVPTRVYAFKQKGSDGTTESGKIWIGVSDGLPRRADGESQGIQVSTTIEYGGAKRP